MYLGPPRRQKQTSSPWRVLILVMLIIFGAYIIAERPQWARPFEPTPTPTRSAESFFYEAEEYYDDGLLDEAIAAYRQAVAVDPMETTSLTQLVRLMVLRGHAADALHQYGQPLAETETAETYAVMAFALDWMVPDLSADMIQVKRANDAELDDQAIAIPNPYAEDETLWWVSPNIPGLTKDEYLVMGGADGEQVITFVLERERRYLLSEAERRCKDALRINPDYAEAHAYLAEIYADLGSWYDALDEAQLAISLDERSVDAHRTLAYVYEVMGDYEGAIIEYETAIALHPRLSYLHVAVGRNYLALSKPDYDKAIASFEKAIEIAPDEAEGYDLLGWTYGFYKGEPDRAIIELERAVELDPNYASAYGHLGWLYYAQRNYEDAIINFERAVQLGTTSAEYYYELGLAYIYAATNGLAPGYSQDDLARGCEKGLPWLDKALEIDPYCQPCWDGVTLCEGK
ncbi:MAG: tetratricopeptide repeat protein [Chloroflexota bacterium]|nr:tetratricopeptide repeat protein [Chloroflexota bacterium]